MTNLLRCVAFPSVLIVTPLQHNLRAWVPLLWLLWMWVVRTPASNVAFEPLRLIFWLVSAPLYTTLCLALVSCVSVRVCGAYGLTIVVVAGRAVPICESFEVICYLEQIEGPWTVHWVQVGCCARGPEWWGSSRWWRDLVWPLRRWGGLVDVREVYGRGWISDSPWVSWRERESRLGKV